MHTIHLFRPIRALLIGIVEREDLNLIRLLALLHTDSSSIFVNSDSHDLRMVLGLRPIAFVPWSSARIDESHCNHFQCGYAGNEEVLAAP